MRDEATGELVEDLDDVIDMVLEYNVANMSKVSLPDDQVKEIMRTKARIIDEMLSDNKVKEFPQSLPWDVYIRVMRKVTKQKKGCFRDIIKSSREFKYALYLLLDRMYREEELLDEAAMTWLTKLWKKKGSPLRLKDNRFIHGKEGICKLFEKCIVQIVADKLEQATPQCQAGSRKGRSTHDQLLKLVIIQKYFEKSGKPLPLLFVDVASCFDRIQLSDVIYDSIQAGADLKAVRMIHKFSDNTQIKIRGEDRSGRGALVKGTTG